MTSVGNHSESLAIQNTRVPFLFFWESGQMDLESAQVDSGVGYWFVQCNGQPEHRAQRVVSQRLMQGQESFLPPVTFYWGISQRKLLQWPGLLPHLLGQDHCDFSSCICSTGIYRERGMEILEYAWKPFSWLDTQLSDSYIPAFTDFGNKSEGVGMRRIVSCHQNEGRSSQGCRTITVIEQEELWGWHRTIWAGLYSLHRFPGAAPPPACANNPAKQLVSAVVEAVHLITQAMLISLSILQVVARLILESHHVPVKKRKERSNTYKISKCCAVLYLFSSLKISSVYTNLWVCLWWWDDIWTKQGTAEIE